MWDYRFDITGGQACWLAAPRLVSPPTHRYLSSHTQIPTHSPTHIDTANPSFTPPFLFYFFLSLTPSLLSPSPFPPPFSAPFSPPPPPSLRLAIRDPQHTELKLLMNADSSRVELFNLSATTYESDSLALNPAYSATVERLKATLLAWSETLGNVDLLIDTGNVDLLIDTGNVDLFTNKVSVSPLDNIMFVGSFTRRPTRRLYCEIKSHGVPRVRLPWYVVCGTT
jgi:hypothetical protein